MTLHHEPNDNIQTDDTVRVRWGHFGVVTAKVIKVMPDGGLRLVRYNNRRECWTSPKRYYKRADGRGLYAYDMSDPSSHHVAAPGN